MDEAAIPPEPPGASDAPKPELVPGPLNLGAILSIPVMVQVVLGSTSPPVAGLMKLARGAIVSLDQRVGDPVDVVVNGAVIARGEIVVVDEASQRFGVSLLKWSPVLASNGPHKARSAEGRSCRSRRSAAKGNSADPKKRRPCC